MRKATRCVQLTNDDRFGAVSPPIYQTSTFRQENANDFGEYDYSRSGNPTRTLLEEKLAELEHGRFGSAFSSGMAAIATLMRTLSPGDEVIAGDDLYGGTIRLFEKLLSPIDIRVKYVDTTQAENVSGAITENTRLIFLETPTNPLMQITDIAAISGIARASGVLLAVDNSVMSPILQNPLSLGADFVVHSATKFLCGHSDVTAGALITNHEELHRRLAFIQNAEGNALAPFDSWLLLRGIKTLDLRVERQSSNALKIAEFLSAHGSVENVYYPGLKTHAGYDVHRRQAAGAGCVISFTTGNAEYSKRVVESLRLFSIAVSFASVNSSVSMPCSMSHSSIPKERAASLAPPADVVRISVGIEHSADLLEDIEHALDAAAVVQKAAA